MKSLVRHLSMMVLLLGAAPALFAAQATDNFTVTATIAPSCTLDAGSMDFGTYDPLAGADIDTTSTIEVFCTVGTNFTLLLNVGTGGGTYAMRTLDGPGTATLNFNLFTASNYSTVWGDGTGATATRTGQGTGVLTANEIDVYGRLYADQDEAAGNYSSQITVTLNY